MSNQKQADIFSKNLLSLLEKNGKNQKDVADAIGVSQQTFNSWCRGIALPRMGKVQLLAEYFNVNKTDLIDEQPDYKNWDAAKDAARTIKFHKLTPSQQELIDNMIDSLLTK